MGKMGRGTAWLLLAAAMLAAAALALAWAGDRTFAIDEWPYLLQRSDWQLENLLKPTGGHLIALGLVLYNAAFAPFGAESHLPLTLLTILFQLLVAGLVYLYAARRLGAWVALLPAVLLLFFGAGWEILLSSATIPNQLGMACGIGALLALDRRDRAGDATACLLLLASIASFTIGLAFAVAAVVRIVIERDDRGLPRVLIVAIPLILYAIWFGWSLQYDQGNFSAYNFGSLAASAFDRANAGLAAITGLFRAGGRPEIGEALILDTSRTAVLIFLLSAAIGWRILRGPRLRPAAWATLALLGSYVLLVAIGLNEVRQPNASRYAYMFTVLLLLAGSDLLAGLRIARAWYYAAVAGLAVSLTANVAEIHTGGEFFEQESEYNRAELGALEIAHGTVPGDFVPESGDDYGILPYQDLKFPAAQYFVAVDRFGSPAYTPEEIVAAPDYARAAADAVLVGAYGLTMGAPGRRADAAAEPLATPTLLNAEARRRGACAEVTPTSPGPWYAAFEAPAGGIAYDADAAPIGVTVGRFADPPSVAIDGGGPRGTLRLPADGSTQPWRIGFQMTGAVRFCPPAPAAG